MSLNPAKQRRDALGDLVKRLRLGRGWTLADASQHCGLAISTISKVENNRLSLTFDNLLRLSVGFGIDVSELFTPMQATSPEMKAATQHGGGAFHETANYAHEYLCSGLAGRRMVPIVSRIKSRTVEAFGPLLRHAGQEFVYVLKGSVALVLENGERHGIKAGGSFYFDSGIGHALLSTGRRDATVLSVLCPVLAAPA